MSKVFCANTNTVYNTPKEAADDLDLDLSVVSRALNGRRPRAGVYLLAYIDDDTRAEQLADLRRWLLYSVYKIVIEEGTA